MKDRAPVLSPAVTGVQVVAPEASGFVGDDQLRARGSKKGNISLLVYCVPFLHQVVPLVLLRG